MSGAGLTHARNIPKCPPQRVLNEIAKRFRLEGQHVRANYDYGSRRKVKKDEIVGSHSHAGRCAVSVYQYRVNVAHIAFFLSRKHWPENRVVYKNGDYRDHRASNLAYL